MTRDQKQLAWIIGAAVGLFMTVLAIWQPISVQAWAMFPVGALILLVSSFQALRLQRRGRRSKRGFDEPL